MSKSSENVKRWRQTARTIIFECLGGKCQICGYNRCKSALETHHVDPDEKDFTVSFIVSSCRSWKIIYEELAKCVLLCTNCHREVHEGLAEIPENYCKFDEKRADAIREESSMLSNRKKRTSKEDNLESYSRHKKRMKQGKKTNNLKSLIEGRKQVISDSDIDFSEYGWITKVASLIGVSTQKVTPWMKRHMLEFYEKKCFKRGLRGLHPTA